MRSWPATSAPSVFVTVPPAATDFHVPSPYQTVVLDAPLPPFRFVTGRLPVTPPPPDAARLIAASRAIGKVPLEILPAFSALIVADGENGVPLVVMTVVTQLPALVVASPVSAGRRVPHPSAPPVILEAEREVIQEGLA